ncbi:MAG: hypothetical protein A2428_08580 [Bdellovibrionales bacterium RIFOXYC1_FULL_54_43]|nr:MAG: hypothetical protein A2428_08580 [Bdellovibrionales bacterium RIFOXYC1_FULL_54_43]
MLIGYLAADRDLANEAVSELRSLVNKEEDADIGLLLAELRMQIRWGDFTEEAFQHLVDLLNGGRLSRIWYAEACFVLGRLFEVKDCHVEAARWYHLAYEKFQDCGLRKKSVKSFLNSIIERSKIDPSLNYIEDYKRVFELAICAEELGMAGTALMNISRELQMTRAYSAALEYSDRALELLNNDFGSLHYYFAVLHRSHVLLDLERFGEAMLGIDETRASLHLEIISAREQLEFRIRSGKFRSRDIKNLTPQWRERVLEVKQESSLARLEDKLIHELTGGPKAKEQLISVLWPEKCGPDVLDMRLKALIQRVRKKWDKIIIFENGLYRLGAKSSMRLRRRAG